MSILADGRFDDKLIHQIAKDVGCTENQQLVDAVVDHFRNKKIILI